MSDTIIWVILTLFWICFIGCSCWCCIACPKTAVEQVAVEQVAVPVVPVVPVIPSAPPAVPVIPEPVVILVAPQTISVLISEDPI